MKNKAIEYPHPVLNEYTNDFVDCDFSIEIVSHSDNGSTVDFEIKYILNCSGIDKLLHEGIAKIYARLICYRTSFRTVVPLNIDDTTVVSVPKKQITDMLEVQSSIVATSDYSSYALNEFNTNYFGSTKFVLRKGDVIANEPGIKIKLNTTLEKNAAGVVQVTGSQNISEMTVNFPKTDEMRPEFSSYIVITLPDSEYKSYGKLMKKRHMKTGIERFLQASVILPAITEGIAKLRMEETVEQSDEESTYIGTVWADSIKNALATLGIDDLSADQHSDYELANKILGNVCGDSLNNLFQKITDWSTIRQEDETL